VTGSLGDVMKESMQIAYTYARSYLNTTGNRFLEENEVHIHCPEGAVPKDGPSAGVAIASSLISLATNQALKQKIGMTGEISLRGNVMKIGGVKEKVLAGKREGLTDLIFPEDNRDDIDDLKDYIKDGIQFHLVKEYSQVASIVFAKEA
jgi:ATP-dependent Lon protease